MQGVHPGRGRGLGARIGDVNGIGGWLRLRGTRAPGVVSPAVMARTTGAFFTFGGVFGLAQTAVMPVDMRGSRLVCGLLAAACLFMGIVILALGDRIPVRQQQWLLFSPTPFVAAGVWESTSNIAAIGVAGFFVTVTCTGAFFLSWPAASANTVIGVVCCTTTLGLRPGLQWWAGLVTSGVVIAVFFVVGVLMRVASEADVDPLTGLLNRRGFARQLELEIARATKSRTALALILVDLDRFKDINDESGHAAGDVALQEVADTWRKMLGTNAILARIGGDEFTLLLPGCCERDAVRVAESMRNAISVGCSAGITAWHLGESASFMVSRADVGLYRAKEAGRNRSVVETSHQPLLAAELVEAIENDRLNVAFQPIVAVDAGASVIGFEALLRWCSATQKGVTPAEIIRVAEEYELISSLGRQVLATACRQAVVLQRMCTDRALMLSVNVSGLELIRADYVRSVNEVLQKTGWPSAQLVLGGNRERPRSRCQNYLRELDGATRAGRPNRNRRFRHRLFVAEQTRVAADRHTQVGCLVCRCSPSRFAAAAAAERDREAEREARPAGHHRRCRERRAGSRPGAAGIHSGTRLLLRTSAGNGHPRRERGCCSARGHSSVNQRSGLRFGGEEFESDVVRIAELQNVSRTDILDAVMLDSLVVEQLRGIVECGLVRDGEAEVVEPGTVLVEPVLGHRT